MFTVRRIGWTLTAAVVILWTIFIAEVIGPDALLKVYLFPLSPTLMLFTWFAVVLIGLIWIVVWFGSGLIGGLRGERSGSPNRPTHRDLDNRSRQA